ncbi:MAG: hypothetical protein ACKVT0_09115 [Planctomycetaceae bacterium]
MQRRDFLRTGTGMVLTSLAAPRLFAADETPSDKPLDIGSNKILFVDEKYIAEKQFVRLHMQVPHKTGEISLEAARPWESATLNWFSVLKEDDRYRMWYECYDVDGWPTGDDTSFCYAESTDGIHWTKPKLKQFTYQGSNENNILFRQIGEGTYRSRVHGCGVFLDPTAPPEERYKGISQGLFQGIGERPHYVAGMTSPDGLHWTRLPKPICPIFADSQYSGFWDTDLKQYVIYGRVGGRGRSLGRSESKDFSEFPVLSKVLETDESEPAHVDLYNPAAMKYPGTSDLYLMFPNRFDWQKDTLDIRFATSRDGIHWSWPDRDLPFIPLGDAGEFDSGSLYLGQGLIQTETEMWFYYGASRLKHEETTLEQLTDPKNQRRYSRVVLPLDRLVAVENDFDAIGSITTPPLKFNGKQLSLNAKVREGGSVKVGLIGADGNDIAGHTLETCEPIMGDSLAHTVAWTSGPNLPARKGEALRLRIELRNASLFAMQFVG